MGRSPCCDKANVKRGPWSPEEDRQLKEYIENYGTGGNWISLPRKSGLRRCGKSCRLRWLNYLRPNTRLGDFSADEDRIICSLFATIGSRWSIIAAHLPGRTDNDIKNYWNTKLKKRLLGLLPLPPPTHRKPHHQLMNQHQDHPLLFRPPINIEASSPPSLIASSTAAVLDLEGIPVSSHLLSSLSATASSLPILFGGHQNMAYSENGGLEMEKLLFSSSSSGRVLASLGNNINYSKTIFE